MKQKNASSFILVHCIFSPPWSVEWEADNAPCFTYNLKTAPEIVFWLSKHAVKAEKLLQSRWKLTFGEVQLEPLERRGLLFYSHKRKRM